MESSSKGDAPLTDVHKRTLQKCQHDVVQSLEIKDIIDICHRDDILTSSMIEEVMAERTPSERCRAFLRKLETRSIKAFNLFIDALSGQYDFLEVLIQKRLRKETLQQASVILKLANDIIPSSITTLDKDELENNKLMLEKIGDMTQQLLAKCDIIDKTQVLNKMADPCADPVSIPTVGAEAPPVSSSVGSSPSAPQIESTDSSDQGSTSFSSALELPKIVQNKSLDESVLNFINSLAGLPNGNLVITGSDDMECYNAFLFDQQLNVTRTLVPDKPSIVASAEDLVALSCTGDDDVGMVRMFDIRGKHIKDITSPAIEKPGAITLNQNGELIVADDENKTISYINIGTGKVEATTPGEMFGKTNCIAVANQNTLLIADFEDKSVKIINRQGGLLSRYTGDGENKLVGPISTCVDKEGQILIADLLAHKIHLLSPEGNFKKILVSRRDGLNNPTAVTVNQQGEALVSTSNPAMLYILKYMT